MERAEDEFQIASGKLERAWGQANLKAAEFLKFSLAEASKMKRMILEVEMDEHRKCEEANERAQKGDSVPASNLQQRLLQAEEKFDEEIGSNYLEQCRFFYDEFTAKVHEYTRASGDVRVFKQNVKKTLQEYAEKMATVKPLPHSSNPTRPLNPPV